MAVSDWNNTKAFRCKSATVSSTAKAVSDGTFSWTAGDLDKARVATVTAHTANVVYTYDGSTPTATNGHVLPANSTIQVQGNTNIQALQFIRQSSDATVSVTLEN